MANVHKSNPQGKHVNLNHISVEKLSKLPMVGRERAESIINYRTEHGPFKSWDDLRKIPGFVEGMIEDLKQGGATLG